MDTEGVSRSRPGDKEHGQSSDCIAVLPLRTGLRGPWKPLQEGRPPWAGERSWGGGGGFAGGTPTPVSILPTGVPGDRGYESAALFNPVHSKCIFHDLGLRFLVRLCTDIGLKEAQEYATKLKRLEKMKETREQVCHTGQKAVCSFSE